MRDRTAEQALQRLRRGGETESAACGARALRIFVDPSGYHSDNAGELAMLMVALQRLRSWWPNAMISVQTLDPTCIQNLDPAAVCIDAYGARGWSADAFLAARSARRPRCATLALDACRWIKRRQPRLMRALGGVALRTARHSAALLDQYLRAVSTAHLVVLSGAGCLNDTFKIEALIRLETLELARHCGATTALLGQGLGPMRDAVLRSRAAQVLPNVDFVALRDGLGSLGLLDSLGVRPRELSITGDDAVMLGYQAHRPELGNGIGVNLRVASYSGIDCALVGSVAATLHRTAAALHAPLVPIAISRQRDGDDVRTARQLTRAGWPATTAPDMASPAQVLELLQRCRVVVVGSYHAAVLALAMGIPAVMIAGSEYYVQRLRGVAHQFGVGCEVLLASQPELPARLRTAVTAAWATAASTREPLLAAARRQISASEAAYRRLFELVATRTH